MYVIPDCLCWNDWTWQKCYKLQKLALDKKAALCENKLQTFGFFLPSDCVNLFLLLGLPTVPSIAAR